MYNPCTEENFCPVRYPVSIWRWEPAAPAQRQGRVCSGAKSGYIHFPYKPARMYPDIPLYPSTHYIPPPPPPPPTVHFHSRFRLHVPSLTVNTVVHHHFHHIPPSPSYPITSFPTFIIMSCHVHSMTNRKQPGGVKDEGSNKSIGDFGEG